ncbi:MAG: carboxypeptidase-like regulatory domain-containing protein, partial [Armatimonadota bacterium]
PVMAARHGEDARPRWFAPITAVTVGAVAVLASLFAFDLLVGDAATHAAELDLVRSYMYWSQPFIYIMAGLLAGAGDGRRGPISAPVVGVLLATICWLALHKQDLLPPEGNVLGWLITAGALFALGGAMIAPLIKDNVGKTVGGIIVLGIGAFIWTYLNLGTISGVAQRELITRVGGETRAMQTVPVPDASVALLDTEGGASLYTTHTNNGGRYRISGVPVGDYTLSVRDPVTQTVVTNTVEVTRSITGGTRWASVSLPTLTEDSGPLFE